MANESVTVFARRFPIGCVHKRRQNDAFWLAVQCQVSIFSISVSIRPRCSCSDKRILIHRVCYFIGFAVHFMTSRGGGGVGPTG